MIIGNIDKLAKTKVMGPGVEKASKQVLISPKEGWDGYVMRVFELEPGGKAPAHTHPWPHINYFLEGQGIVHLEGQDYEVREGSYSYIPSNAYHQIMNNGTTTFKFICIVPEEGEK